jgi:hypothetical protein
MLTEMSMKASGKTIRHMEEESTLMLTDQDMKESGLKISSMDSVLKDGLTEHHMKDIMLRARNMDTASSLGLIIAPTLENFLTTTFMEEESTNGPMEESSQASGVTTRWKVTVPSPGQTAGNMWATT